MNERIRELAEQAKAFIIESEHAKIGEVSEVSFDKYSDLEKFAELIVRECINICNDIADPHLYRNQDILQRMNPGASYAAKVIKLHFGVE